MKRHAIRWRPGFTSLIIGTVLVFVNRSAFAQGQNPDVVSPQQVVAEMTYDQWSAAWWQRMLAILFGKQLPDPTFHSTGVYCNVSQSGPEMLALLADIALLHWYADASGLDFMSAELTRSRLTGGRTLSILALRVQLLQESIDVCAIG
jgi:hypothetical protein